MDGSPKNSFFSELKRRKVVRVAVAYLGAASISLEIADNLLEVLVLDGLYRPLVIAAASGLPVAVVLAWVFDLTLKGVERTEAVGGQTDPLPDGLSSRFTRQLVISGAIVILAMTGVGWRYMPSDGVEFEDNRVAVASFINETGDPQFDVLGSVVARALSREFELLQGLVVDLGETLPGMPAERSKGAPSSPPSPTSVAQALSELTRARFVVGGSYLPSADGLLLTVEVYDAEQQERVFIGDPVPADPTDPMAAVLEVKETLFGFMASLGDAIPMMERATVLQGGSNQPSYAAYSEYVKAVELIQTNPFARREMVAHMDSAVALDSTYTRALISSAYFHAAFNIDRSRAQEHLDRLESMRATLTPLEQAGVASARAKFERDLEGEYRANNTVADLTGTSISHFNAATASRHTNRPRAARAHLLRYDRDRIPHPGFYQELGLVYHLLESHRAELRLVGEAREQLPRPMPAFTRTPEIGALVAVGRADEALELLQGLEFERAGAGVLLGAADEMEAHGDPTGARTVRELSLERHEALAEDERRPDYDVQRGLILASLGRDGKAGELFQRLIEDDSENFRARIELAFVAARTGDHTYAEETISWLGDRLPDPQQASVDQARIAAALGDAPRTVRLLQQAERAGEDDFRRLHVRPEYRSVRDHPAFKEYAAPRDTERTGLLGWLPRFIRPD